MKINPIKKHLQGCAIAVLVLGGSCGFALAQEAPLVIKPLNDKLHVYTTYNHFNNQKYAANALYLVTKKGVILFDTPWDVTQYQPLLDSIQNKHHLPVIAVYASHWHDDRAGGFSYYEKQGIPTYATTKTNGILREKGLTPSTHEIELGKTIRIGGERFVIDFVGEGHSTDNTVVWFPKYKILNGGCLVKSADSKNMGFVGDGNIAAWPESIRTLQSRFPIIHTVIAGHDNWQLDGAIEKTIELLNTQ